MQLPALLGATCGAEAGAFSQKPNGPDAADTIFATIEGLFALHQKGILNDEEFSTKKQDLLSRL